MATKYFEYADINTFDKIDPTVKNICIYELIIYNQNFNENLPIHVQNIVIHKIINRIVSNGIGISKINQIGKGKDINYFFPKIPFGCKIFYTTETKSLKHYKF